MNLVVDTSVIIAVIANESQKAALITRTQGADLLATRSLPWEIGNAFSAMFKRGRITAPQAKAAIEIYRQIPLTLVDVDLVQAIELASQLDIYAYDAYIIVCAINQKCPLISLDSGLIYAAQAAGVEVLEVAKTDADIS
ncbi:MAG: type II toxin-antitoxin system VapC family toxin [Armatimonadetes bacterium]|nr:type II toxin-antitoxin system VapC family toxin [Armatimonadota bacterium]